MPSFAVDDGFSYAVPDGVEAPLGAIVRVPLGGRRVRGWVVAASSGDAADLKAVASRSGDLEVFDRRLLDVMRWAAVRYVAPLATVLGKATPPNLPRARAGHDWGSLQGSIPSSEMADSIVAGRRPPTQVWWGPGPWAEPISSEAAAISASGRGVLVVAATVTEAETLADQLRTTLGDRVVSAAGTASGADQTKAWVLAASRPGTVLVGTRGVALWPVKDLAAAFLVGEARRGMKDKSTPTTHARELLVRRSQVERIGLVLCGLVPSAEALGRGSVVRQVGNRRAWGQVEVVDRRTEDASGSLLGPTARAALRVSVAEGRRVMLFTHRRATAQRCARCRTVRVCGVCGSGSFDEAACARCGGAARECVSCRFNRFEMLGSGAARVMSEAARVVGRQHVGEPGSGAAVIVATERDLLGLAVDLVIIVDGDGPTLAPTYRAGEDALRLFARAVATAGSGHGRRGLIQTSDPAHPVIEALKKADPIGFVTTDSAIRAKAGFPPGGELVVVEVGDPPDEATADLAGAVGDRGEVLGPADVGGRVRWLIQGTDLTAARVAIRAVVARWRDGGARVRIDADPVDL